MPRDTSKFPPRVTHYTDDPTRWPWPDNPCHSHVLGWDRFTDTWALVSCSRCLEHRPTSINVREAADMTDQQPIADLYVCWHCNDHAVEVPVGADPPEYHTCGHGPLQWSGQLYDRGSNARTYELRATRVEQRPMAQRSSNVKTRQRIYLDQIDDNPWQPRREMEPEPLQKLADNMDRIGLLQIPMARPSPAVPDRYQTAFGHRRVASVRLLDNQRRLQPERIGFGLDPHTEQNRPYIEMDVSDEITDEEMAVMALSENVDRRQLTQMEVLRAHRRAVDETNLTLESLAEELGVGRSTLSNNLRLLALPDFVLEHVESGALRASVAREFLVLRNDDHEHAEDMRKVIERIGNTYDVVRREEPPNWSRRNVRRLIGEQVAMNEADFRPLGPRTGYAVQGAAREPSFDVQEFSADYRMQLHTIPSTKKDPSGTYVQHDDREYSDSRVWTCQVKEWSRRQSRATREANAAAPPSGGTTGVSRGTPAKKNESRDQQFERALAKDPVWRQIPATLRRPAPKLPLTDAEKNQLGTRAEFKTVERYGSNEFWKRLEHGQPEEFHDWEHGRKGGRVAPFFNLDDCKTCVAGAAYGKDRYGNGEVELVCTNAVCYDRKLSIDTPEHREKVEAELRVVDDQDGEMIRVTMGRLALLTRKDLRTLASSLIAAQPELELTHFMRAPHKKWSYKPGTLRYLTGMLRHRPAQFDQAWGQSFGKAQLDLASLDEVPDDDLLELVATLMTYHLRQAGKLETVSRETAAPALDALDVREMLTGETATAEVGT